MHAILVSQKEGSFECYNSSFLMQHINYAHIYISIDLSLFLSRIQETFLCFHFIYNSAKLQKAHVPYRYSWWCTLKWLQMIDTWLLYLTVLAMVQRLLLANVRITHPSISSEGIAPNTEGNIHLGSKKHSIEIE